MAFIILELFVKLLPDLELLEGTTQYDSQDLQNGQHTIGTHKQDMDSFSICQ